MTMLKREERLWTRAALLWIAPMATLLGCVDGVDLPNLPLQATVEYSGRIYLVDATRDEPPMNELCTRIGVTATSSDAATIQGRDGIPTPIPANVAHSCFVRAVPKALKVDVVEATNDLFQLCYDSGQCKKPDPNDANQSQVCSDKDRFDACPIVEVSQDEASRFCGFLGRRLPTGIEHIVIRQAGLTDTSTGTFTAFPTGNDAPVTCDDAVLKSGACLKPRPVLASNKKPQGAATHDVVLGTDGVSIHDLLGNVSEWTADLFPATRPSNIVGYPWFCSAPLPGADTPWSASNPPTCPSGSACVFAQYKPADDLPLRADWPLCITAANGQFTGSRGALFGGSYRDEDVDRETIGIFGRRVEREPNELPDTARAREYGIRCVGDREPDAMGVLPEFDDKMELETAP
ncbi:MAG: SUMF1/EgtB/PvdO family nonheme iron enzyme [Deltaproteobacteria bacterium]|nr:SUMF1/EgtB/PvdO family nonheme iron enzyme [Deltaproteobacteria bacterium]